MAFACNFPDWIERCDPYNSLILLPAILIKGFFEKPLRAFRGQVKQSPDLSEEYIAGFSRHPKYVEIQ